MNSSKYPVEKMCKVLKVSRSGYYHWLSRKPSVRSIDRQHVTELIVEVYQKSKRRYGSPKITAELRQKGLSISRPRVARIMRSAGIRSIISKKYRVTTTDSKHQYPIAENHLNRNFKTERSGQAWVSDITYIPTKQGWVYLTIIMDLFDRKIIGWALSTTMTTSDTTIAAWKMALKNRPINAPLIFHSDRGVQFAANSFKEVIAQHQVIQSMSRKGDCWDNAVAENFFKILKSELVNHSQFNSILHAKNEVFEFIEIWYNRRRKHSTLGYLSPHDFGKNKLLIAA